MAIGEGTQMNRRDILKAGVAAGALGLAPRFAAAQSTYAPVPKGWRSYVLTMRVEPTGGANKAWIPLPTFEAADWQRPGNVTWTGNARVTERVRDPRYGAEMLRVEWAADQQSPLVEVTAQVQAQDRSVVPGQGNAAPLSDAERKLNLAATELLPTDGLVKETAQDAVKGKQGDVAVSDDEKERRAARLEAEAQAEGGRGGRGGRGGGGGAGGGGGQRRRTTGGGGSRGPGGARR